MKKLKIFFIILIALIFTLVIAVYMMYKSDMKRIANKEPVKYSNWGYAYTTIIGNSQTNSKKIEKNRSIISRENHKCRVYQFWYTLFFYNYILFFYISKFIMNIYYLN